VVGIKHVGVGRGGEVVPVHHAPAPVGNVEGDRARERVSGRRARNERRERGNVARRAYRLAQRNEEQRQRTATLPLFQKRDEVLDRREPDQRRTVVGHLEFCVHYKLEKEAEDSGGFAVVSKVYMPLGGEAGAALDADFAERRGVPEYRAAVLGEYWGGPRIEG